MRVADPLLVTKRDAEPVPRAIKVPPETVNVVTVILPECVAGKVIVPPLTLSVPADTLDEVMIGNVMAPLLMFSVPADTLDEVMLVKLMLPDPVFSIRPDAGIVTAPSAIWANVIREGPELITLAAESVDPAVPAVPKTISAPTAVRLLVMFPEAITDPLPPKISPPAAPELVMDVARSFPVEAVLKTMSPLVVPLPALEEFKTGPTLRPVEFDQAPVKTIRPLPVVVPVTDDQLELFVIDGVVKVDRKSVV